MKRIDFFCLSFLYAFVVPAADAEPDPEEELAPTQIYISQDEIANEILPLSLKEVSEDLNQTKTVRCQIKANLLLSDLYKDEPYESLCYPVICVGTGRDRASMKALPLPTYIREQDISIDQCKKPAPDFQCDALQDAHLIKYIDRKCHYVFFAHVGYPLFTVQEAKNFKLALYEYKEKLLPRGIILYSSEVKTDSNAAQKKLTQFYQKDNYEGAKQHLINLFKETGFVDVEFIIKDESQHFLPNSFCFLILARNS